MASKPLEHSNDNATPGAPSGRAREAALRIRSEVRSLMKNVPVSGRNVADQLLIAWDLEVAASAIRARVQRARERANQRPKGRR